MRLWMWNWITHLSRVHCTASRSRNHTWYLSFLSHRQHFQIKNFTPKNWLKTPQNTQKFPWKVKYMQLMCSIWKILHLTEYFYTGTAHGARNNYQVCDSLTDLLTYLLTRVKCRATSVAKKLKLTVRMTVLGWREGVNITKYSDQIRFNLRWKI